MTQNDFGRWLDDRMRRRGLTDRGLAVRTGLNHSTISRARNGHRGLLLVTADAIARGLGEVYPVGAPPVIYGPPPKTDAERTRQHIATAIRPVHKPVNAVASFDAGSYGGPRGVRP